MMMDVLKPMATSVVLCSHLVASTAAVHENLSGGLHISKYCICVDFDNRPVYDSSSVSLWKHTTVCKIFIMYFMFNKRF